MTSSSCLPAARDHGFAAQGTRPLILAGAPPGGIYPPLMPLGTVAQVRRGHAGAQPPGPDGGLRPGCGPVGEADKPGSGAPGPRRAPDQHHERAAVVVESRRRPLKPKAPEAVAPRGPRRQLRWFPSLSFRSLVGVRERRFRRVDREVGRVGGVRGLFEASFDEGRTRSPLCPCHQAAPLTVRLAKRVRSRQRDRQGTNDAKPLARRSSRTPKKRRNRCQALPTRPMPR